MVAEGISDAEGDILEKVRQAVGPSVPVVSTLDLHGNISAKMVANADAFFGFDTNPHVDPYERAVEPEFDTSRRRNTSLAGRTGTIKGTYHYTCGVGS
jgi:microcystin degradation protein MlrC